MTVSLTLKNVPDELYERLKAAAAAHRRSINNEAIVCLESVLRSGPLAADERLSRARELRAALSRGEFSAEDIDSIKREGRS